jgi:RNA polymerase sigma-70 factor (ECF subfamily)
MTDGDLVRQCLAGHRDAYEPLVRSWASRVLAVCHARVARADVAEELAQESLFRGYKALSSLAEPDKFGPWLCGIATRVCLDWLKAKERTTIPMSALGEATTPDDLIDRRQQHRAAAAEDAEDVARLMEEVERLPEKHREALMLYYYQDCTYQDLAKLLGVSAATVNARLTQARQMLRERLVQSDEQPQTRRIAGR